MVKHILDATPFGYHKDHICKSFIALSAAAAQFVTNYTININTYIVHWLRQPFSSFANHRSYRLTLFD